MEVATFTIFPFDGGDLIRKRVGDFAGLNSWRTVKLRFLDHFRDRGGGAGD